MEGVNLLILLLLQWWSVDAAVAECVVVVAVVRESLGTGLRALSINSFSSLGSPSQVPHTVAMIPINAHYHFRHVCVSDMCHKA